MVTLFSLFFLAIGAKPFLTGTRQNDFVFFSFRYIPRRLLSLFVILPSIGRINLFCDKHYDGFTIHLIPNFRLPNFFGEFFEKKVELSVFFYSTKAFLFPVLTLG